MRGGGGNSRTRGRSPESGKSAGPRPSSHNKSSHTGSLKVRYLNNNHIEVYVGSKCYAEAEQWMGRATTGAS